MNRITTTLRVLRKFDTWQDAGELGDDPTLTDETPVFVRENGSVAVIGGGDIVSDGDAEENPEWLAFVASLQNINDIDFAAMAHGSKSHTDEELREAFIAGKAIWSFDSGTSGNDDVLIYDPEVDAEQIMEDLNEHFQVPDDVWDTERPNPWTLERLTEGEMLARWRAD